MSTVTVTVYGDGGYDPDAVDGNVVERYEVDAETGERVNP